MTTSAESLPVWDLSDLFPDRDGPELEAAFAGAAADARRFAGSCKGGLANLDGDGLAAAVAEFERIDEVLSRIMSYAQLLYAGDVSSPEIGGFYQSASERVSEITTETLFFTLELNKL